MECAIRVMGNGCIQCRKQVLQFCEYITFLYAHSVTPSCHIKWNLSIKDTAGTQLSVLCREVSLIQR